MRVEHVRMSQQSSEQVCRSGQCFDAVGELHCEGHTMRLRVSRAGCGVEIWWYVEGARRSGERSGGGRGWAGDRFGEVGAGGRHVAGTGPADRQRVGSGTGVARDGRPTR